MPPRKEDFIRDVTTAIGLLSPTAETDSAQSSATGFTAMMRGAELWLSPRYVEQFHAADFPELTTDDLQKLTSAVSAFRAVSATVPAKGPASPEQSEAGRKHLLTIYEVLKPTLDEFWNPAGSA